MQAAIMMLSDKSLPTSSYLNLFLFRGGKESRVSVDNMRGMLATSLKCLVSI